MRRELFAFLKLLRFQPPCLIKSGKAAYFSMAEVPNGPPLTTARVPVVELFQPGKVVHVCAPMVRYSKLPFRALVRRYNCDLAFTPMIIAESFVKSLKARDSEFTTNSSDRPLVVQFAARDAVTLADASEIVAPYSDGIDLNCGCPQRWAMAEGYGSCLLKKPELISDMVRQARARVSDENFSVSVKIRLHKDLRETVDLCQKAEHAGVSWIAVHGRTPSQRGEPVNTDAITLIKQSLSIPVIANGDIKNLEDVKHIHTSTGIDGVMAARGILQNPGMYAGYDQTPLQCVQDWVDLSIKLGTHFTCFHHHLMYMFERVTPKSEKRVFNALTSTAAVLDYLQEHYGVSYNPDSTVNNETPPTQNGYAESIADISTDPVE
ncbi:tRNA-dihydrouridine(20a/20b) synthase [NAD(P)+]-like isoform X1 [Branchiostoma lanceolatum]|uniref:tRNA-dihydrouridine(20a/20b) synthase [NAD(P)+]-like isoform X1 n=2 Tax=Branchiostoma lanceolatum TaxID=7740 RepID=UPI003455C026